MEILLTEAQEMLKKSAREFLKKECPKTLVRELEQRPEGYSPELWRKMAEMGWLGMPFPEEYGGSGSHFTDVALVVEEMGYAALISPFFSTVVECGLLILEAGSERQKRELLPRIARGESLMALAFLEPDTGLDARGVALSASRGRGGYTLSGTKLFVSNAHIADRLICVARTRKRGAPGEGISLFLVDAKDLAIEYRPLHTTASDRQWEVVFKGVHVPRESLLGQWNRGWQPLSRALERATALKCAEMLGGAQVSLDLTVEYAKNRVQFGRPIGSFQAVHHHLADMYRDVVTSRLLTYQAAWRLGEGLPASQEVSMAKAKLSYAYPAVTRMAHQIHGGVGYYTEYDLELYYRRALAGQVSYGDAPYHRELIAKGLDI